ncbi:hypothetical protein Q8A73_020715, partial [Channa argus]
MIRLHKHQQEPVAEPPAWAWFHLVLSGSPSGSSAASHSSFVSKLSQDGQMSCSAALILSPAEPGAGALTHHTPVIWDQSCNHSNRRTITTSVLMNNRPSGRLLGLLNNNVGAVELQQRGRGPRCFDYRTRGVTLPPVNAANAPAPPVIGSVLSWEEAVRREATGLLGDVVCELYWETSSRHRPCAAPVLAVVNQFFSAGHFGGFPAIIWRLGKDFQ